MVSTLLKNMLVKLGHFVRDPGENTKYLKPPASYLQIDHKFKPDVSGIFHLHSQRCFSKLILVRFFGCLISAGYPE